ncbi:MAG: TRAP transporter small permease [Burkholderiaceae bacterium]
MKRLLDLVTDILFAISGGALAVMLMSYLTEVGMRYFLNAPTRWSSDVVSYAMLVSIAFALPVVTRDGGHVAITAMLEWLSPPRRRHAHRALAAISALSCACTSAVLFSQSLSQMREGIETVAALSVPKWWLSASVGMGLLLAALHFACSGVRLTPVEPETDIHQI